MTRKRLRNSFCLILAASLGFLLVPISLSQQQSASLQAVTCRLATNMVVIEVEVIGMGGVDVWNLGLGEFSVFENGEKQKIDFFSRESEFEDEKPRTKYLFGYYPIKDLTQSEGPRKLRIRVNQWKSRGFEVRYSPQWIFPTGNEGEYSPTWYLPMLDG